MPLEVNPRLIPLELKEIKRWLVWKEVKEKNPKTGEIDKKKIAISEGGFPCRWKNKDSWVSFEKAMLRYETEKLAGIGIVLDGSDGLFGIDLDDSFTTDKMHDATYTEMSPSGEGLRSFGFVEGLEVSKHPKGLGLFTHNRWLSVTGHRVSAVGHLSDCTKTLRIFLDSISNRKTNGDSSTLVTLDKSKLNELIRENWRFARIWKFEAVKDYESLSDMDGAVAWHAIKSGWTNEETIGLLNDFRHRLNQEGYETKGKEDRLDYAKLTVEKARAKIETQTDELPYLTLEQALEVPATKWLVDGVVPEGGFGMIWGHWGTCKTFMMLDLSMRLICNMPWFGERKCRHGDVLYILSEGRWTIGERLRAWFNHHRSAEVVGNFAVWESAPQIVNSSDVNDIAQFIERRLPKCKLVVIDTLSRSLVGQNENDTMFMTKMVDQMTRLAKKTNVAIILVHHATKGGLEGPPTARGSSSIQGAVDYSIEVNRVFVPGFQRKPIVLPGVFEISMDKARGGPPIQPFPLFFKRSGPGVVLETDKILTEWLAHRRRTVQGLSAEQFVSILGYKKLGKSPATMEGLLRANGIGMSRARIETVLEELFPSQ